MTTISIDEFTPESFAQRAETVHDTNGSWYRSMIVHAPSWSERPFAFHLFQESDTPNLVTFTFDTKEDGDDPHEIVSCFAGYKDFFARVQTLKDNPPAPPSHDKQQPHTWVCPAPFNAREHSMYTRHLNRYHITHCAPTTRDNNTVTVARAHIITSTPTTVIDVAGSGEYDTLALHLIHTASRLGAGAYGRHMRPCPEHPDCCYLDLAARVSDALTAESFYWDNNPT